MSNGELGNRQLVSTVYADLVYFRFPIANFLRLTSHMLKIRQLAIGNRKSAMTSLPFKDLQRNYKAHNQPRAKNRHVHPIRR
jgi:hypothetical protein